MAQADHIATGYDYDKAAKLINSSNLDLNGSRMRKALARYESRKTALVPADMNAVAHIFFHSLIIDVSKAFDGGSGSANYNPVMATKDEFLKVLEDVYQKGHMLVRIHGMAHEAPDENGNIRFVKGSVMLPEGKKPFVMSRDDVYYYSYMDGDGSTRRAVIGEDGRPTYEMIMDNGTTPTGSHDLVPLLKNFIQEHPDFSYKEVRAIITFTGYEGILGYKTVSSYQNGPTYEAGREQAARIAQCLKDNGRELASCSWGRPRLGVADDPEAGFAIDEERFRADTDKWEAEVGSLIGPADIILYPYDNDIADWRPYHQDNPRFAYLESKRFRCFCNVDASKPYWTRMRTDYFRVVRRNLDGYRLCKGLIQTDPSKKRLTDLFDATQVFDSTRPTPVSWSYRK